MKQLTLVNFKAFGSDKVSIGGETSDGKPMNVLCFGENGSGKSSVYESIKYVFHKSRLERERVPAHLQGQARENAKQQILIDYKNKMSTSPLEININGQSLADFDRSNYFVYLLNNEALKTRSYLNVKELLKSLYLASHNIDEELTVDSFDCILDVVNESLRDVFCEEIQLFSSQNIPFQVVIEDSNQNLRSDEKLNTFFNEAKLHLVALLLVLESIQLFAPVSDDNHKILVFDDIVTSLDTANRTFFYQYLVSEFSSFQIIMLTHNTSFYNLFDHFLKEDYDLDSCWLRQGIYEYNFKHYIYAKYGANRIKEIEDALTVDPSRVHDIGNDVRQYFEVLLHQLSLMLMAGAKEETSYLLKEIEKKCDNRSFHITDNGIENLVDLFKSIDNIIHNVRKENQLESIKKKIAKFNSTSEPVDKLSENLKAMTIYQKVALHQSSHGHAGLPDLTVKEIKASLQVLKKLEVTIDKMKVERI